RMIFCPGMGTPRHREFSIPVEPIENAPFLEGNPIFFSTNLEMIHFSKGVLRGLDEDEGMLSPRSFSGMSHNSTGEQHLRCSPTINGEVHYEGKNL
ncbi:MAG: hypothetical protein NTV04_11025, partial [Deltaproteobacteria bacterium]|nr:hypothetical protein [Deltaproteobacteria bacterium]